MIHVPINSLKVTSVPSPVPVVVHLGSARKTAATTAHTILPFM
jgi:hypothetical protein